jgi:hypothetical protein
VGKKLTWQLCGNDIGKSLLGGSVVVVVVEVEDFSVGPPKPPGGRVLLAGFLHAKMLPFRVLFVNP